MKEYLESSDKVLSALDSTAEGLTAEEAAKRLEKNGKNKLADGK